MKTKKLSEISVLLNGYAFKSKNYAESGIRVIRIANVQDGYIIDDAPCYYPVGTDEDIEKFSLFAGDLLISLTGNVGRVGILPADMLPAALNQRVCCLRIDEAIVDRKYLLYYLRRYQFMRDCVKASKGVAQLNLSTKWLAEYEIPLPAIEEQKHIVARIEELFSELDNGVETLRKTKQQLAVYRRSAMNTVFQSVLQDAVTTPMGEVLSSIESGKSFKCEEHPPHATEYGIVKVSAVTWGTYNEEESKTCLPNQFIESKRIKKGDFLFSRANTLELVGNCVVVENVSKNLMLSDKILRFHFKDSVIPKYVMYYLRTHEGKKQIQEFSTGNQESMRNIGQDRIKRITVPMCSTVIQDSAVHEIEARLSVCDGIEKAVDMALQQAEAMRQSILKQAFEVRM